MSYDVLLHISKRLREHAWPETEAELAWSYLMKSRSLILSIASLNTWAGSSVFWGYVIWIKDDPFSLLWYGGNTTSRWFIARLLRHRVPTVWDKNRVSNHPSPQHFLMLCPSCMIYRSELQGLSLSSQILWICFQDLWHSVKIYKLHPRW